MIKLIDILNELSINNPRINAEKVEQYCNDNILYNDIEFEDDSKGWYEYKQICQPYCKKYGIAGWVGRGNFKYLSQQELIRLFNEMRQLVKKHVGKEILNESLNNYIIGLDDIEPILNKQFPDKKLEIIKYIESINIEPNNYQNLTYNHLIDDFTNFIYDYLNELEINKPKSWIYKRDSENDPYYNHKVYRVKMNKNDEFTLHKHKNHYTLYPSFHSNSLKYKRIINFLNNKKIKFTEFSNTSNSKGRIVNIRIPLNQLIT